MIKVMMFELPPKGQPNKYTRAIDEIERKSDSLENKSLCNDKEDSDNLYHDVTSVEKDIYNNKFNELMHYNKMNDIYFASRTINYDDYIKKD